LSLATKFGIVTDSPVQNRGVDGTPENARRSCDRSLERLGGSTSISTTSTASNPKVPIEETVGAMAELVRAGKVKHLGLSEASAKQCGVHIRFIRSRRSKPNSLYSVVSPKMISCQYYVTSVSRWWPTVRLGRGFLGGRFRSLDDLAPDDWRRGNPRFQGEHS